MSRSLPRFLQVVSLSAGNLLRLDLRVQWFAGWPKNHLLGPWRRSFTPSKCTHL